MNDELMMKILAVIRNAQDIEYEKDYTRGGAVYIYRIGEVSIERFRGNFNVLYKNNKILFTFVESEKGRQISYELNVKEQKILEKARSEFLGKQF
jgi:hypothetical protein